MYSVINGVVVNEAMPEYSGLWYFWGGGQNVAGRKRADQQFVIDVIKLYKKLPCLWKVADPDYHDKNKRDKAMEQLIDLFKTKDINANKDIVKRKINSMRGSYRKESNKVKASLKSGARANQVHMPKLWYYDLLTFLEDPKVESTSGTMESVLDNMPFGFDEDCEEDFNESASVPSASRSATMLQGSSQAQITRQRFKRPRSKADQVLEKISRRLDKPLEKQRAIKQKDKYDIFGECVDEKLRSLQPNMGDYCQKLITDAIFLAETGNLNVSSKIVTSMSNSTDMNSVT
ncbi:hypothetical protein AVEN_131056-1 [Araneus ventricosus]|uniref:MADF domain-containing protein n=1 Tax=Araneus ventricosus TaxID=182803 RepID=A0A4Y2PUI6_ARAVE|nr:hypothetical protein AVEN_131056-1 [Araneus ventricosus]